MVFTSALLLAVASVPALAINDRLVPAGGCAQSDSAVGTPQGGDNPGLAQSDQVDPAASRNNPGVSTGAQGHEESQAFCNPE